MKTAPLDAIARLDNEAFLHILQSILHSQRSKYSPEAHTWVPPHIFAEQSFASDGCSHEEMQAMLKTFMAMFNIEAPLPPLSEHFGNYTEAMYKKWRAEENTVTFFTSGSTGTPKPCMHPEEHLRQELMGIVPLVEGRKSALVTAPLQHLYGFTFGLLLPLSLNIPIRLEAPIPTAIFHQIQENDLVVTVPFIYARMAELSRLHEAEYLERLKPKNAFLIAGSAPFAQENFEQLLSIGLHLVEFFGSSEMGVMCCRQKPGGYFALLPQFEHIAPKDAQSSDVVRRTFPDLSTRDFELQDSIDWKNDRELLPQGRKDSAVQVGGVNVFPDYVAKILNEHPSVLQCVVRLMRPEEGHQLKAFVVLHEGCDEENIRKELRTFGKQKLKQEEQPARFTFGKDIPRGLVGKPADW